MLSHRGRWDQTTFSGEKLNERMADSLQRFWDLVAMAAVQGALGERGKGWDHDFKSIGRQIAED